MKKYHTLLVVAISILVVLLLTWFLPITYLNNGELFTAEKIEAGVVSTATYSLFTFYNFIYVFIYLLLVGGLYGVLNKCSAYRVLLDRIVKHVKNHRILYLILTVLFISVIVSFTGYTYEILIFLPFIAAVVLLLGYDKITAAMVTIGGVSVGVIGSTFSKTIAGKLNGLLEGVSYTDLIIPKVILLLVCGTILVLNIILYAKKKSTKEEIEESFLVPKKVTTKNTKVWPLVTIFAIFVIVFIMAGIDWSGAFSVSFFSDALTTIKGWSLLSKYIILTVCVLGVLYNILTSLYKRKKEAKKDTALMSKRRKIVTIVLGVIAFLALLKIMLEDVFKATDFMNKALEAIKVDSFINALTFDKVLGNVLAFGSWSYNDYALLLVVLILAIKFSYHVKMADVLDNIGEGCKKVLYACLVALLSYSLLILISSHPIGLTIIKPVLGLTKGLNILTYPLCTLFSALFNSDFAYYEYGVLNVSYVATAYTGAGVLPLAEFITQTMYGFAIILAPTSVVLLFTLSLLDIKYTTWLRKMLFVLLELLVVIVLSYVVLNLWVI